MNGTIAKLKVVPPKIAVTTKLKAVTILSGGMDSAVLAYELAEHYDQTFLSFNYGQRHKKELKCAQIIANNLGSKHHIIDLTSATRFLKGSALTDTANVEMPEGFYAEENMRLTVVPNRNAMMLSIAWAVAVGEKAGLVFYGAHKGDHFIYEDCRPEFVDALSKAFSLGTHGPYPEKIEAPFIHMDKSDIAKRGVELDVPFKDTWTCYRGEETACGVCGSCQERLWSFDKIGVVDPIAYKSRKLYSKGELVQGVQGVQGVKR